MKKLICIILLLLVGSLFFASSFNKIKERQYKYDYITYVANNSFQSQLLPMFQKTKTYEMWLNYYQVEDNKWGRIYFETTNDYYDFNEAYTVTMHFLEEFCIENNFRRPVLREAPEVKRRKKSDGVLYTRYEAYIQFFPK